MGFISNLFNDHEHQQFPPTTGPGSMQYEDSHIAYRYTPNATATQFCIDDIRYVYVVVAPNQSPSLHVYTNREHYLRANFHGFEAVYQALSARFGFNDRTFFAFIKKDKERAKQLLWRKEGETTYQLLPERHTDYLQGFEVQLPQKEFISWDITYDELATHEPPLVTPDAEVDARLNFTHPVRVGSVLFDHFYTFGTSTRKDIAVFRYFADCVHEDSSDQSFRALKKHLQQAIPAGVQPSGYHNDDYARFAIEGEGMCVSLGYAYDTDWHFERGLTTFAVLNHREYPALLVDSAYESVMEISEFLLLGTEIRIQSSYKDNSHVKRRPPLVSQIDSEQTIIWKDHQHHKIGFADASYAETFSEDAIQSVTLQNILPAKGGGGAYLMLQLNDDKHPYTVFYGTCHALDPYRREIEKIVGKELIMPPEYHDC